MYYHLDIEQQIQRIMNNINFTAFTENQCSDSNFELNNICD
jgi:hypothetical protein